MDKGTSVRDNAAELVKALINKLVDRASSHGLSALDQLKGQGAFAERTTEIQLASKHAFLVLKLCRFMLFFCQSGLLSSPAKLYLVCL